MIEKYPRSRVAEAYEPMHSGKVRFRVVLTMRRVTTGHNAGLPLAICQQLVNSAPQIGP